MICEIKMKVEQIQSSSSEAGSSQTADLNALRDQMEKLRICCDDKSSDGTHLEIASDTEFRLLRLEKRMQTLLALGGNDAAAALVQQDTIGAGESAAVRMSRDVDTGLSSWSVEEGAQMMPWRLLKLITQQMLHLQQPPLISMLHLKGLRINRMMGPVTARH